MLMLRRPQVLIRVGINLPTEGPGRNRLRAAGLRQDLEFMVWATAACAHDVYREVAERRWRWHS